MASANRPARPLSQLVGIAKYALTEPVITGGLLYLLTRGPVDIRERILRPFQTTLLATNGGARLSLAIGALKVLTAWGVMKRINHWLNRVALNNWRFGRPGAPFAFGPAKEELVVITGGCSGFGYEMVKLFHEKARVVVFDISPFPEELARLSDVHYYQCDVTDTQALVDLCEEVRRTHGDPTVLVNNAGIASGKTVLETTNEQCEKLFKVNLISHFVLIREFLPGMLQKKKGHIVTIASMASFVAAPGLLDYCCSKIGALYLNDGIRAECMTRYPGGEGICTTSVHPSWHSTAILKGTEEALKRHGIIPDPAINVSRVVVEQVLQARSGRIHVPLTEEGKAGLRSWPLWFQDLTMGHVFPKRKRGFVFGSHGEAKDN